MKDSRLHQYEEAIQSMARGRYDVEVPAGSDDEVARLGSALKDLATSLESRFRELQTLVAVTEKINAGLILDEILNYVYESFRPIIPYHRIGFSLLEDDGVRLAARWARSDSPNIKIGKGYSARMEGSSLQQIIATGRPRILNDLEEYLKEHPKSDSTRLVVEEGMRSSLTCPLIAMGRPVGFMFFSSMDRETYSNIHVAIFQQIAGQLSMIVEKGRLYQQLVELNELKNRFLGIAAHDLRSPITVFSGYLDLLIAEMMGPVTDEQKQVMDRMRRASKTMLSLINELLNVAAIESGRLEMEMEEVELASFLTEMYDSSELLARHKEMTLKLELPDQLPAVEIDRNRIGQVVSNLITNAVKFSYPETEIILGARESGDYVEIYVKDQGQGIPEGEQSNLFTEYGRTSVRPTGGEESTGLGLAIVKKMVQAHGGDIRAESSLGVGSTFTFSLPVKH